ncbi:MAG TPA: hypothetical protein EYP90_14120 [Chromatiaceae bacterium]|nr:hypothetical protein [Chromatiaceae bacterium]
MKDYAAGKITPEMAVGHSLQHIEMLYEAQQKGKASNYKLRGRVNELEHSLQLLQTAVTRITNNVSD